MLAVNASAPVIPFVNRKVVHTSHGFPTIHECQGEKVDLDEAESFPYWLCTKSVSIIILGRVRYVLFLEIVRHSSVSCLCWIWDWHERSIVLYLVHVAATPIIHDVPCFA